MADQPKRSAFDPEPEPKKGGSVPTPTPPASADKSESGDTSPHEKSIIDGIKGLIGMNKKPGISEGGKDVMSAVDEAVSGVPGNSTDY